MEIQISTAIEMEERYKMDKMGHRENPVREGLNQIQEYNKLFLCYFI